MDVQNLRTAVDDARITLEALEEEQVTQQTVLKATLEREEPELKKFYRSAYPQGAVGPSAGGASVGAGDAGPSTPRV